MSKNNQKADKLRAAGNAYYQRGDFCEALLAYNSSLCLAETDTEAVALAYGNRSAVYFCLKEFELCLQNIHLARTHSYPIDKIQKLDQREKEAKELEKRHFKLEDAHLNFFKMSFPPNSKHPYLAECLAFKEDKTHGKHIITTRDLKPGDVVAMTESTFSVFDKRARLHHCSNCKGNAMILSLIPCPGCIKAMYCSEECKAEDLQKFHQFECSDSTEGDFVLENKEIKLLSLMLYHFDWDVSAMRTFFDTHKGPKASTSISDFDMSDPKDRHKNMLLAIMRLKLKSKKLSKSEAATLKAEQKLFLQKHPKLKELFASKENQTFLNGLLQQLPYIWGQFRTINLYTNMDMNFEAWDSPDPTSTRELERFTNTVLFCNDPYRLLLKHSCDASVHVQQFNGKSAWVVLSPLKAGEPICLDNLPLAHKWGERPERQKFIKEYFGFICECDACRLDYQFKSEKRSANTETLMEKYVRTIQYSLLPMTTNKGDHSKLASDAIETLPILHKKFPNKEFWIFQATLMKALNFLAYPSLFEK